VIEGLMSLIFELIYCHKYQALVRLFRRIYENRLWLVYKLV